MKRTDLTTWLDRELDLAAFRGDHSNNGLQVEGRDEVNLVAFAVDGVQATFEAASAAGADFLFVHHGISWGGEPRRLTGITAARLRTLFQHGISLYAAHLPLDANALFGNNAELARLSGVVDLVPYCIYDGVAIGFLGRPAVPFSAESVTKKLEAELNCRAQFYPSLRQNALIRRVAVVSGGGGLDALEQGAAAGADLLITGEMTHVMYHAARELGVAVLALGHYASETTGPRALMKRVERECGVACCFLEEPTGL